MKRDYTFLFAACFLLTAFAFFHRRVIRAKLLHEPMPKAPEWHCWVPAEQRK